jgi:hypothetical protein
MINNIMFAPEFDTTVTNDKWFRFSDEEEKVIGDHIAPR